MQGKQIKLSSNVSAVSSSPPSLPLLNYLFFFCLPVSFPQLRFIQAAQTKVKHEELKKKQEKSLGWYLPGFEEVKTRGSDLAKKDHRLEHMYILARKSFNSYNQTVESQNSSIVSRRRRQERAKEEKREEKAIQNMFKKRQS